MRRRQGPILRCRSACRCNAALAGRLPPRAAQARVRPGFRTRSSQAANFVRRWRAWFDHSREGPFGSGTFALAAGTLLLRAPSCGGHRHAINYLVNPRQPRLFAYIGRANTGRANTLGPRRTGQEATLNETVPAVWPPLAKSIATVSLSGTLPEKLEAAAAIGFDGVEIFENDLLTYDGSPDDVRAVADGLGLAITIFQPFRDFEAMPEPQRQRNVDRAERKFDVMQALGADLLLVCSNVNPATIDDPQRAAADF